MPSVFVFFHPVLARKPRISVLEVKRDLTITAEASDMLVHSSGNVCQKLPAPIFRFPSNYNTLKPVRHVLETFGSNWQELDRAFPKSSDRFAIA
jgi:hypothetical protein